VNGIDAVTSERYDAFDPRLLLWVHACLEICSIEFYEMTVRPLSLEEKERYHNEVKTAASLVLLPKEIIPETLGGLHDYVDSVLSSGVLRKTDVSEEVAALLRGRPPEWTHAPVWGFISFAAFQTLPDSLKEIYGVKSGPARKAILNLSFKALSLFRPFLPFKNRVILPARIAEKRVATGESFRMKDYL